MPVKKEVEFSSLNDGDTFIYKDDLYMKVYCGGDGDNCNAVSIANGKPDKFLGINLITKVDGSFVVQSDCDEAEYEDPYEDGQNDYSSQK